MTKTLRSKYHLSVTREMVRCILRQVDPAGVAARRSHRLVRRTYWSRGPNHTWHVDGYDKLRPYGFLISGLVLYVDITFCCTHGRHHCHIWHFVLPPLGLFIENVCC